MKMNTVGIEPRGIVHIPIDAFFFFLFHFRYNHAIEGWNLETNDGA